MEILLPEIISLSSENLEPCWCLYNQFAKHDNLPLETFKSKTVEDPDFDPELALAVWQDDAPEAIAMAVCRNEADGLAAGFKFFGVAENRLRQGLMTSLFNTLEERLKERGVSNVGIGFTRPNYITAGLDPRYTPAASFLMRRGYQKGGDVFNMDVDLTASDFSTDVLENKLLQGGITVRGLLPEEDSLLERAFEVCGSSEGWRYQVRTAFRQSPPAVIVAFQNDDPIAFACFDGVRPGWFGPMATAQSARGEGIGTATYLKCLQMMKERGYNTCVINAVGPLPFYARTSAAVVSRVFWLFSKQLVPW